MITCQCVKAHEADVVTRVIDTSITEKNQKKDPVADVHPGGANKAGFGAGPLKKGHSYSYSTHGSKQTLIIVNYEGHRATQHHGMGSQKGAGAKERMRRERESARARA